MRGHFPPPGKVDSQAPRARRDSSAPSPAALVADGISYQQSRPYCRQRQERTMTEQRRIGYRNLSLVN